MIRLGGLHGVYPELDGLDRGDLIYTTDFRGLYKTIIRDWWRSNSKLYNEFESLKLII